MRQNNLYFMPVFLLFFLFGTTAFTSQKMTTSEVQHIFLNIENHTQEDLLSSIESKLNLSRLESKWGVEFHNYPTSSNIDYKIVVIIKSVSMSTPCDEIKSYKEEKQILVRNTQQTVRPRRDTSCHIPPKLVTKTVTAWVEETQKIRHAKIKGTIEYYDVRSNKLLKSKPISSQANFKNASATYEGDFNALSLRSRKLIRTPLFKPPSDDDLIQKAAIQFPSKIKSAIKPFLKVLKRKK